MTERQRKIYRLLNALFWLGIYIALVIWSDSWRSWFAMFLEAWVPLMLGGYIHIVLRRGGSAGDA
jgi:hypothetical protein